MHLFFFFLVKGNYASYYCIGSELCSCGCKIHIYMCIDFSFGAKHGHYLFTSFKNIS